MKTTILAALIAMPLALFALAPTSRAADAPATSCKDGTTSTSTGKGTCSGHGGVQKTPKTTTCTDGTTSTSSGKGTCSSHGGVKKAAPPASAN